MWALKREDKAKEMGRTEFTVSEYRNVKSADPGAPAAWGKAPLPGSRMEKDGTKFVSFPAEQPCAGLAAASVQEDNGKVINQPESPAAGPGSV